VCFNRRWCGRIRAQTGVLLSRIRMSCDVRLQQEKLFSHIILLMGRFGSNLMGKYLKLNSIGSSFMQRLHCRPEAQDQADSYLMRGNRQILTCSVSRKFSSKFVGTGDLTKDLLEVCL